MYFAPSIRTEPVLVSRTTGLGNRGGSLAFNCRLAILGARRSSQDPDGTGRSFKLSFGIYFPCTNRITGYSLNL
jgi:hypothetical protein